MNKLSQAWVSVNPSNSDVSIFVNDGFQESLVAFARERGFVLQLISPDVISRGGTAVTLEYYTSLSATDAKHLLSDWETIRG